MNKIQADIIVVDESRTNVSVNNGLGKITQYKKYEMIGQPYSRAAGILRISRVTGLELHEKIRHHGAEINLPLIYGIKFADISLHRGYYLAFTSICIYRPYQR